MTETQQHETETRQHEPVYSARDARQGEIILRTPLRRFIFIAGLGGGVVLALIFMILAHAGPHVIG